MYKGEKNKNKKEKVMFFKPIEESMSVSSEQSAGLNAAESQLKWWLRTKLNGLLISQQIMQEMFNIYILFLFWFHAYFH